MTGHSSGDQLIKDTMILQLQKMFTENDPTSNKPFLNIFDKGYHQILEMLMHGEMCCQPDIADDSFKGDKVLQSGCIAVV